MKYQTNKILAVIFLTILILFTLSNDIYAEVNWGFFKGFYYEDTNTMIDTNIEIGKTGAESSSKQITERLLGITQVIGSIISVIALIVIGIRYMISSVEDRANMKGVLIYYIIGAVLVFATTNILSIAYQLISELKL